MFSFCKGSQLREQVEEKETVEEEKHSVGMKKQVTSSLYDSYSKELDGNKPRVLFVSDNLPLFELLVKAAKDSTIVVPVKHESWTLDDLTKNTLMRLGTPCQQYASMALMDHGREGEFNLLKSVGEENGMVNLKTIQANPDLQNFFKLLGEYVRKSDLPDFRQDLNSRIDLLACNVAAGDGPKLVEYLEDLTHVNWAASTNQTGNTAGSDWVMETEKGLGAVDDFYFNEAQLAQWQFHCEAWTQTDKEYAAAATGALIAGGLVGVAAHVSGADPEIVGAATVATSGAIAGGWAWFKNQGAS